MDIWYIKHVLSALSLPTKGAFICTFTIPLSRAHPNTSMTRRPYTIVHPHVKNNKQECVCVCNISVTVPFHPPDFPHRSGPRRRFLSFPSFPSPNPIQPVAANSCRCISPPLFSYSPCMYLPYKFHWQTPPLGWRAHLSCKGVAYHGWSGVADWAYYGRFAESATGCGPTVRRRRCHPSRRRAAPRAPSVSGGARRALSPTRVNNSAPIVCHVYK